MHYREVTCYEFPDGSMYRTKEEAEQRILDGYAATVANATAEQLANPHPELAEAIQGIRERTPAPEVIAAREERDAAILTVKAATQDRLMQPSPELAAAIIYLAGLSAPADAPAS